MSKFNTQQQVKITNYGEMTLIVGGCTTCNQPNQFKDMMPDIVGSIGKVEEVISINGRDMYTLSGIPSKKQFYYDDQLQLV